MYFYLSFPCWSMLTTVLEQTTQIFFFIGLKLMTSFVYIRISFHGILQTWNRGNSFEKERTFFVLNIWHQTDSAFCKPVVEQFLIYIIIPFKTKMCIHLLSVLWWYTGRKKSSLFSHLAPTKPSSHLEYA